MSGKNAVNNMEFEEGKNMKEGERKKANTEFRRSGESKRTAAHDGRADALVGI